MKKNQFKSKLNLDNSVIKEARKSASKIAYKMQKFIDSYTTVSVERTVCRILGIDGVNDFGVPLANIVVNNIQQGSGLGLGAAFFIGNAMIHTSLSPQEIAEQIADKKLELTKLPIHDLFEIKLKIDSVSKKSLEKIKVTKKTREDFLSKYGDKEGPLLYVIVATGNIYEDVTQAVAAAKQGADVIAVIRTTGQSLLDYIPYGATTEGFGGTYATQENFRIMRKALDDVGEELGRYIRLVNYASGLCMPEISIIAAFEGLDFLLNDALYGILFRDINMKRTLIDQYFSRMINAFAGITINTGEDNYLTTSDAFEEAHTVLASQFINEQFALLAGLKEEQMGLGHAFEMNPSIKNGFLYEIAQAQMAREIFPNAPLKYMPPTKFITGNIFKGHIQDALFNIVTIMTNQKICLLGMLTEAIHTPFMHDRALSIENAKYIFNNLENLGDEITFQPDGIIETRAKDVLAEATELLQEIEKKGLFQALSEGIFAGIKRNHDGGKGLDGVVPKDRNYYNPFIDLMKKELGMEEN
ncbi:lysine 5,6-aminomutase subunit alpha [Promethearchaeum syntrophicum]|uniref:Lysine 5,6-aminomutase subunit alpha n=1 Tax=Promethearchaeum syntrophicum TaxID=2594042 RepID=A0A5B9D6G6_9ARCH|nr:lysine 5,6-aminomutase subunit alpha [Candidatus Prometheoarchaeum syntrophicum]QEE14738.1 D-Lysine 5,6-aminomutase alpha subunit [Candidatus Prometheoarchaeum syntrophicum]